MVRVAVGAHGLEIISGMGVHELGLSSGHPDVTIPLLWLLDVGKLAGGYVMYATNIPYLHAAQVRA